MALSAISMAVKGDLDAGLVLCGITLAGSYEGYRLPVMSWRCELQGEVHPAEDANKDCGKNSEGFHSSHDSQAVYTDSPTSTEIKHQAGCHKTPSQCWPDIIQYATFPPAINDAAVRTSATRQATISLHVIRVTSLSPDVTWQLYGRGIDDGIHTSQIGVLAETHPCRMDSKAASAICIEQQIAAESAVILDPLLFTYRRRVVQAGLDQCHDRKLPLAYQRANPAFAVIEEMESAARLFDVISETPNWRLSKSDIPNLGRVRIGESVNEPLHPRIPLFGSAKFNFMTGLQEAQAAAY